jgi:hypothetical protein
MAIQVQGNSGVISEVGANRALRVVLYPYDYAALGQYKVAGLSGTMAAGLAANAEIFQLRWTDATRLCLINSVVLNGLSGSATAFAAGFAKVDLLTARSWSADGSGGTTLAVTGNNQKLRTSMGTSLMGAIRVASTAALTAGTKTLDAAPMGLFGFSIGTVANVIYVPGQLTLFDSDLGNSHPIVLATNEGIVCRATVPATGTWQFGITVNYTELAAF